MGASTFGTFARGTDVNAAFSAAHAQAGHEDGYSYSGTLSAKHGFTLFRAPAGVDGTQLVQWVEEANELGVVPESVPAQHRALVAQMERVYDDKWGPACAVPVRDGFYFFGWASS